MEKDRMQKAVVPQSIPPVVAVAFLICLSSSMVSGQALHDRHEEAGVACSACHREAPPKVRPPDAACVACHGTMLDRGRPAGAASPDPHASPHLGPGEVPACGECHHAHRPSEATCGSCHRGFQFQMK